MRVLIMSVTAGGGHNSTAAAIESGLRAGGAECHVLDTLKYINSLLDFTVSEGLFVCNQASEKTVRNQLSRRGKTARDGRPYVGGASGVEYSFPQAARVSR